MKTIEYVGYSLMIVAYTIFLIKNLEFKLGLIISLSTIIAVFIISKYLSTNEKENDFEHTKKITQSVGNDVNVNGDLTYKDINLEIKSK